MVEPSYIPIERMRELFECDFDRGVLIRRVNVSHKAKVGAVVCGSPHQQYRRVIVDGKYYLLHRILWAMANGEQPEIMDHIDGNKHHNALTNLRSVTWGVNTQNRREAKKGKLTSDLLGVYQVGNRFRARIKLRGVIFNLGHFGRPEDASAAYVEAKRKMHAGCTL